MVIGYLKKTGTLIALGARFLIFFRIEVKILYFEYPGGLLLEVMLSNIFWVKFLICGEGRIITVLSHFHKKGVT